LFSEEVYLQVPNMLRQIAYYFAAMSLLGIFLISRHPEMAKKESASEENVK
jgi:hypothetical protein